MSPLKIYVGMDNKFVLCEKFPNDEQHAGLHDMLDFLYFDDDPFVYHRDENGNYTNENVDPGFYLAYFTMQGHDLSDPEDADAYLIIDRLEKIGES